MNQDLYRCFIVDNLDSEHRRQWQSLWEASKECQFFNSPGFFEACLETYHVKQYRVVFCYREEILCAVLPLVADQLFGIKVFATPGRKENCIDHCFLLVDEYSAELVQKILSAITAIKSVYLGELSQQEMDMIVRQQLPFLIQRTSYVRYCTLSSDTDVLQYMSSSNRSNLLSRIRQMDGKLDFRIEGFESIHKVKTIEAGSHRSRYMMALFEDEHMERFLHALNKYIPGGLCIGILYFEGHPIATNLGFMYKTTFCFFYTAFLEKYRRYGSGKMSKYYMLNALKERGFEKIDFFRGDSELKQQFAVEMHKQYNAYVSGSRSIIVWWKICVYARRVYVYMWSLLRRLIIRLRQIMHRV